MKKVKGEPKVTMETLISGADRILQELIGGQDSVSGIVGSRNLFQECAGICLLSSVEVGFILSGSAGSGILLAKTNDGNNSSWSETPLACRLSTLGLGVTVGFEVKDWILFFPSQVAMMEFINGGIKLAGFKTKITVGQGQEYEWGPSSSSSSSSRETLAFCINKGLLIGPLSLDILSAKNETNMNKHFYGSSLVGPTDALDSSALLSPQDILNGSIPLPPDKPTDMIKVLEKLEQLSSGNGSPPRFQVEIT